MVKSKKKTQKALIHQNVDLLLPKLERSSKILPIQDEVMEYEPLKKIRKLRTLASDERDISSNMMRCTRDKDMISSTKHPQNTEFYANEDKINTGKNSISLIQDQKYLLPALLQRYLNNVNMNKDDNTINQMISKLKCPHPKNFEKNLNKMHEIGSIQQDIINNVINQHILTLSISETKSSIEDSFSSSMLVAHSPSYQHSFFEDNNNTNTHDLDSFNGSKPNEDPYLSQIITYFVNNNNKAKTSKNEEILELLRVNDRLDLDANMNKNSDYVDSRNLTPWSYGSEWLIQNEQIIESSTTNKQEIPIPSINITIPSTFTVNVNLCKELANSQLEKLIKVLPLTKKKFPEPVSFETELTCLDYNHSISNQAEKHYNDFFDPKQLFEDQNNHFSCKKPYSSRKSEKFSNFAGLNHTQCQIQSLKSEEKNLERRLDKVKFNAKACNVVDKLGLIHKSHGKKANLDNNSKCNSLLVDKSIQEKIEKRRLSSDSNSTFPLLFSSKNSLKNYSHSSERIIIDNNHYDQITLKDNENNNNDDQNPSSSSFFILKNSNNNLKKTEDLFDQNFMEIIPQNIQYYTCNYKMNNLMVETIAQNCKDFHNGDQSTSFEIIENNENTYGVNTHLSNEFLYGLIDDQGIQCFDGLKLENNQAYLDLNSLFIL